eukprot:3800646-Rhodomonas_salina.1
MSAADSGMMLPDRLGRCCTQERNLSGAHPHLTSMHLTQAPNQPLNTKCFEQCLQRRPERFSSRAEA